jgi:hypothetical protein
MSKFLLNLLLQISKALVNSKIQFLIQKFFPLLSARPTPRPIRPLAQPAHRLRRPCRPKLCRPAHPARASVVSSRKIRFPFRIMPSRAGRLSHVSVSTGPHLSDSPPSPTLVDPGRKSPSPPLPRTATLCLGWPRAFTALPHHSPPLIPFKLSLNAINGIKAITAGD